MIIRSDDLRDAVDQAIDDAYTYDYIDADTDRERLAELVVDHVIVGLVNAGWDVA